jgi:hypothetical protein
MPKVPSYNPTQGIRTPGVSQMSPEVATAGPRALGGLADTMGQAGNILVKLQEQRNVRLNNIEALNIFSKYNEDVRVLTDGALQKQGSDAMNLYPEHEKALQDLSQQYMDMGSNDRVRDMFTEHAYRASEASKSHVASHQAREEKSARDQAVKNLIQTQADSITARPDADQVALSLASIGKTIDLQYPPEQAVELKKEASLQIKSSFILAHGQKNPREALTYLEDWKNSGDLGAQNYLTLKSKLENQSDEFTLDALDKKAQGYSPNQMIDIMANPAKREKFFPGLTLKQATEYSGVLKSRVQWNDYKEKEYKEQQGKNEFKAALEAFDAGDTATGEKLLRSSTNLNTTERAWLKSYHTAIDTEHVQSKQAELYTQIDTGAITTNEQLAAATRPLMLEGATGKAAATSVKGYFATRKAEDGTNYTLAEKKYKDSMKTMGLKSPPSFFASYLRETCTAENIHGSAILEKADKLIGYVEEKSFWPDTKHSPIKEMEKSGTFGIKANPEKPKTQPKKPATSTDLLKGYPQADIDGATEAIKKAYPNLEVTPDRVKKVLDANKGKK